MIWTKPAVGSLFAAVDWSDPAWVQDGPAVLHHLAVTQSPLLPPATLPKLPKAVGQISPYSHTVSGKFSWMWAWI